MKSALQKLLFFSETLYFHPIVVTADHKESDILSERNKRQLLCTLYKESETTAIKFFDLTYHTVDALERKGVTPERLKTYISLFPMTKNKSTPTIADVLESAVDVLHVFLVLKTYGFLTFYNFKILGSIIKNLCNELEAELEEYKLHFNEYIKRRVHESALYYGKKFHQEDTSTPSEVCDLILITDEHWGPESRLSEVFDLEKEVADILNITNIVLGLRGIEDNCLRLYYTIPSCLKYMFLSIKQEQMQQLVNCGITEVRCDGFHINCLICK